MEEKNRYDRVLNKLYKYRGGIAIGVFLTFLAGGVMLGIRKVSEANAEYYSKLTHTHRISQITPLKEDELQKTLKNISPEAQKSLEKSSLENSGLLHEKDDEMQLPDLETSVDKILANYKPMEKDAYKEILSHKDELEQIASKYEHINPALLMSVLKKESNGLKYKRSRAGGTGQMQMTFFGAYSFFWKVFTEKDDNYYKKIWERYDSQLKEIFSGLKENEIYVKKNKRKTWKNMKNYFKNNHFYQNVNMGALYLDFLINQFKDETLGLAAYNAGETEVRKAGGIPNFEATNDYITDIPKDAKVFEKLLKG